jgi:hypothetical protein
MEETERILLLEEQETTTLKAGREMTRISLVRGTGLILFATMIRLVEILIPLYLARICLI